MDDYIIGDYDPATEKALVAGSAIDVASGGALMALSEPIHVIIGAVLIATGVFLFGWAKFHRIRHEQVARLAEIGRSARPAKKG